MDLYTSHLRSFFQGQRNFTAHLIGSQRPLKRLTDEIDNLSRYVDQRGQDKLAAVRELVVEKDRLDFARVYLGLTKGWLFVHVPVTYSIIVLTLLHILVVYAYRRGPGDAAAGLDKGGSTATAAREAGAPRLFARPSGGDVGDRDLHLRGFGLHVRQGPQFLMPGPLVSAHSAIGNCDACHTKSGSGKLSWTNGLVAGDPLADSQACLTCHRMPDTAFHPHGASDEVLEQSNIRLAQVATRTRAPLSVRAQNAAFPADHKVARGVYCATCHQEHQGPGFDLKKISSEQCQSCHVVKFNRFDGHHPQFENYPFKRRSRIIYDHAGHFGKHFPEAVKKGARRVPATCSTCHDSGKDKRIMAVAPFEQTCNACHLDQIVGKERVSGPKGIAFLTVPGLDLQTLKEKGAAIGEWPDGPEAEVTPFMKVMIARNERGRALIRTVDRLNLQDLSGASDAEIEAVTNLAWEVKRLFYALIRGKASDVLADLNISCGAQLSAGLVADLTASIPRDVVVRAYQQWLPNLAAEMANRPDTSGREENCLISTADGWVTTLRESRFGAASEPAGTPKPKPPGSGRAADPDAGMRRMLARPRPLRPCRNERPRKPNQPAPSQTRERKPPANGLQAGRRTKPMTCSTSRRRSERRCGLGHPP